MDLFSNNSQEQLEKRTTRALTKPFCWTVSEQSGSGSLRQQPRKLKMAEYGNLYGLRSPCTPGVQVREGVQEQFIESFS